MLLVVYLFNNESNILGEYLILILFNMIHINLNKNNINWYIYEYINNNSNLQCKLHYIRISGETDKVCKSDGRWYGNDLICKR